MPKKTCLITGGNAGIGKAAALQLAKSGFHVAIGCRNKGRGESALKEIRAASPQGLGDLILLDMSSKESIRAAARKLGDLFKALDVLIHNAADFDLSRKTVVNSADGIEITWATNHIGPVLLTDLLMGKLKESEQGRVITIASQGLVMHPNMKVFLSDPEYRNRPFSVANAYYQSKLAQVMYTYWLAEKLRDSDITVNCIRVTAVKIDVSRYPGISGFMKNLYALKSRFSISPEDMASTYTWLATDPGLSTASGGYYGEKNRLVSSSKYSRNSAQIQKLMDLTYTYLK